MRTASSAIARSRGAAILLAALVFAELLVLGANGPLLAVLAATLDILLAIAVILLLAPDRGFWRGVLPTLGLLAAAIAWLVLPRLVPGAMPPAARAAQAAPDLLLPGTARAFGASALLLAAATVGYRRGLMRIAIDWLIVLGLMLVLVGLVLRTSDPAHVWGFVKPLDASRFTGTLLNANANACASGVFAVLAFGRSQALLRQQRPTGVGGMLFAVACPLAVVAAIGACALSGSRTVLSLTIACVVLLTLLDPRFRRWIASRQGAALAGLGCVVVAVTLALFGAPTLQRFATLDVDSVSRVQIWGHYAALALRQPLFGYGPDAFPEINAAHLGSAREAFAFWYINAAHNEPIEMALAGGLPYALLAIAAVASAAWSSLRHAGRHEDDPVVRAVPAALLIVGGDALVDIALDVPAILALSAGLLGMAWGRGLRHARDSRVRATRG